MRHELHTQKRKRDLGLVEWLGRPTLVIELQYPAKLSGKSKEAAQQDVLRMFRYVGRQHLIHFHFVQQGGFQAARKAKFHFHVTATTIEDLSQQQLKKVADDLRASWKHVISSGNPKTFDASDDPCVVWTIEEYVAHYRSKNGTSPLVTDDEVVGRKLGYNFDGHELLGGSGVRQFVCPKPRRRGRCVCHGVKNPAG